MEIVRRPSNKWYYVRRTSNKERSMLSTCTLPTVTSSSVAPVATLATASRPELAPAVPSMPDPLAAPAAPPRARFRRLVVFDGRLA
jgi:hypothetical protein